MAAPQISPRPHSAIAVACGSGATNVKTELEEVSHLSLSTPTQELRRSSRTRKVVNFKEESDEDEALTSSKFWSGSSSSRKRTRINTRTEEADDDILPVVSSSAKKASRKRKTTMNGNSPRLKKIKREYAPPEVYAHLEPTNDYLKDHLDGTYTIAWTISNILYVTNLFTE
jgi:hypothetical protein